MGNKKKKKKKIHSQPTDRNTSENWTDDDVFVLVILAVIVGENSMGALEFSRSNPSASKGKRINKKAIEKPTENEGRAKNKKKTKKKNTKMGQQ